MLVHETTLNLQVNESRINARREEQIYEWIVPVDYASNLDDFSDSFILNKSQSRSNLWGGSSG